MAFRFGEREADGAAQPPETAPGTEEGFCHTLSVSGFQMDPGHTFVFFNLPPPHLHSPPSFQRNLRMGLCCIASFFPSSTPPSFAQTAVTDLLCLKSKGKRNPTDSLSTLHLDTWLFVQL